jgi:hypothetical protein
MLGFAFVTELGGGGQLLAPHPCLRDNILEVLHLFGGDAPELFGHAHANSGCFDGEWPKSPRDERQHAGRGEPQNKRDR